MPSEGILDLKPRPTLRTLLAISLALLSSLAIASTANAAAGDLDPAFATDGKYAFAMGGVSNYGYANVIQPDGKIVVVGTSNDGGVDHISLFRLNVDGTLDSTFGSAGITFLNIGVSNSEGLAAALQSDGKIVVAGRAFIGADWDMAVARFDSAGHPDLTFNGTGSQAIDFPASADDDQATALAIQPNGDIVLAGNTYKTTMKFALARVKASGAIDVAGFGTIGRVTTPILGGIDAAEDVALLPDGRIVAVGEASNGGFYTFAAARYSSSGVPDASFGPGTGIVTNDIGSSSDELYAAKLQPDGKLLVAGTVGVSSTLQAAVARYDVNGSLDASFGNAGVTQVPFGLTDDVFHDLAILPDGKFVAAGRSTQAGAFNATAARFTSNGVLDPTFGSSGKALTSFGADNGLLRALSVQPDGKLVATGTLTSLSSQKFLVMRYLADDPPPPAATIPLSSTIAKSLKGKIKASKLKKISGTAAGTGLAKVQIALALTSKSLLKKKKKCLFVKNSKGATKQYKAVRKKCTPPSKWLTAKGTTGWSYALKGKLKKGSYVLYVRALNAAGTPQAKPASRKFSVK